MIGLLLFVFLLLFMMMGLPVAFSITLSNAVFLEITQLKPLVLIAQRIMIGMDNFPLLAIPMFTLAGNLMEESGLSRRLITCVGTIFGRVPGSMGVVTIIGSTIFAALTGSGPATVVAIGSLMIPAMIKSGYTPWAAAGLVATSGALGPIIPPSIAMIVYGATMGVSIPQMFVGGVMPGLLLMGMLIVLNTIQARRWGIKSIDATRHTFKEYCGVLWRASGALALPVIIMGGIYGGVFTPTEAATVAVVYSMVLGFAYREFTAAKLKKAFVKTAETAGMVVFISSSANLFSWMLSSTRVPVIVAETMVPILQTQVMFLIFLTLLLFFMGAVIDSVSSIIMIAPVVVPIGLALGVDPLHLAVVFCVNLVVGFVTPPFGSNLFVATSISGLRFGQVVRGALPSMLTAMLMVVIITFVPGIITWLPRLAFGK